jgi:flagellar basal-body rod protein FlgG
LPSILPKGLAMNYGLYLSATGVVAHSYRQDVIANNLANVETIGFKRHTSHFRERLAQALEHRAPRGAMPDPRYDMIGGGLLVDPTRLDISQGELEQTGHNLDVAVMGRGFLAVRGPDDQMHLTRDGRMMIDRQGRLIRAGTSGQPILDPQGNPIRIDPSLAPELRVAEDGTISHDGVIVGRIGLFDIPDARQLVKVGDNLFLPMDRQQVRTAPATVQSGFLERSNVDPAKELVALMDAQRQLEANANMIRYQDQTLGRLVNEVGKIG